VFDPLKRALLAFVKLPAEPRPPEGTPGSIRVFRGGQNYLRLRLIELAFVQFLIGALLLAPAAVAIFGRPMRKTPPPWLAEILVFLYLASLAIYLLQLVVTFLCIQLDFEMRWYMVTDRSLRIRSGILFVEEITMTFANIQEIRVNANPLQRLFGLASVQVRSAGGASVHGVPGGHSAIFANVDNAEMIRDLIAERLRQYRDAGLGDTPSQTSGGAPSHCAAVPLALDAAREVLTEVRALRAVIST
jgi:membrane protein YdbS with pleckstrin-like domain